MHPALRDLSHRPWPLPPSPWLWRQAWNELLFVHYPVEAARLRALVPAPLQIQEFGGTSYIGIVPFRMNGVMRRPFPNLPGFSSFLELNVRLYVELDGKPGVWFLSLDATNPLVVWAGRRFFGLPYENARIETSVENGFVRYRSVRKGDPANFEVEYSPAAGEDWFAAKGSLEHFLTERYCFYAQTSRGLVRAEVHHRPWPLRRATGLVRENSLLNKYKLEARGEPLLHYSGGVDVVNWNPGLI